MSSASATAADWKAAWDPVIAMVGTVWDVIKAPPGAAADPVEAGAVRKYIEPLEFDCPLHYDREVARSRGHPDIIAPYTSLMAFAIPPMWQPGGTLFTSDDRNAQPERSSVRPVFPPGFPPVTGYFATDMEFDYLRPATIGDVLRMEAGPLLSCEPKETSVGRGAFLRSEMRIVNQSGELLALVRSGAFFYDPIGKAGA
jgi:hypothetical protein